MHQWINIYIFSFLFIYLNIYIFFLLEEHSFGVLNCALKEKRIGHCCQKWELFEHQSISCLSYTYMYVLMVFLSVLCYALKGASYFRWSDTRRVYPSSLSHLLLNLTFGYCYYCDCVKMVWQSRQKDRGCPLHSNQITVLLQSFKLHCTV